jgi:glutaredoxin-related protein
LNEDFTREQLLELFPSVKTFPVIVVDGFNIGGFQQLKEMIETNNTTAKYLTEQVTP